MFAAIGPHVKKLPTIKYPWDNENNNKKPISKQQSMEFWNKVDQKKDS